jgi:nicotinamidase-related amidase
VARFYLAPGGNLSSSKPRFVLGPGGALELVNSPVLAREEFLDSLLQKRVAPVLALDYWYREDEQGFPLYYHLHTLRTALSVHNAYQRQETRKRLYFDRESEALQLAAAIAEAFRDEVRALGARAYVALIPMRELVHAQAAGAFPLAELLRSRGIDVLDFAPAFESRAGDAGIDALYLPDGHLTALGNRLIAEQLAREVSTTPD